MIFFNYTKSSRHIAMQSFLLFFFLSFSCLSLVGCIKVGRGITDCTGLVAEGSLYGYAKPEQKANGIHMRQFCRAFVFDDNEKVVAFVVAEIAVVDQAVKKEVLERLSSTLGNETFADANLLITATHTHSAPGGYNTFWMYQSVTPGFINETFEALVEGIVQSVLKAYKNREESQVLINNGKLFGASSNRSPSAYYNNPKEETDMYGDEDTDKNMHVLAIKNFKNDYLGALSFFAVHGTSLKNTNGLVSGDNKGYAALRFEYLINGPDTKPGTGSFVAAFSQTAQGDSTPCTQGQFCVNSTTEKCDYYNTTCAGHPYDPRSCYGLGPTGEQFADLESIGSLQFTFARDLAFNAVQKLSGPIDFIHQWVNMSDVLVDFQGESVKTCLPAMGYSFAAGAVDGAGVPPFTQGRIEPIEGIEKLTDYVFHKSPEEAECHRPKPILLPTGQTNFPYPWQPQIVPLQILRIGNLFLVGISAEATTMSGRRLQAAIKKVLVDNGAPDDSIVLIVSLSNSYSSYLTTFEEYQMQRYEGASTIFGPHTLSAFTKKFEELASALIKENPITKGPTPPDLRGKVRRLLKDVKIDAEPHIPGIKFGSVLRQPKDIYYGGDSVTVEFYSSNPRNYAQNDTFNGFVTVWEVRHNTSYPYLYDSHWTVRYHWKGGCQRGVDLGLGDCTPTHQRSHAEITWVIPLDHQSGTYFIQHQAFYKSEDDAVHLFNGLSNSFKIIAFI